MLCQSLPLQCLSHETTGTRPIYKLVIEINLNLIFNPNRLMAGCNSSDMVQKGLPVRDDFRVYGGNGAESQITIANDLKSNAMV